MVTWSGQGVPLSSLVHWLAREYGITVVYERQLGSVGVTLEVVEQPLEEVIEALAKSLSVDVDQRSPRLYFLGKLQAEDRGVLVRRVAKLNGQLASEAVKVLLSQAGKVVATHDGLVIVGDSHSVLGRVADMLDELERIEARAWAVQLYFVSMSYADAREFGVELNPTFNESIAYGAGSLVAGGGIETLLAARLDVVLRASESRSSVKIEGNPFFLVGDGETGKVTRGQRIPIVQRSTLERGQVVDNGVQWIDAGGDVSVQVREVGSLAAAVEVNFERSAVERIVEDRLPVLNRETFQTRAVVRSGRTYLLGTYDEGESRSEFGQWLRFWKGEDARHRVLAVYLRAARIDPEQDGRPRAMMRLPEVESHSPTTEGSHERWPGEVVHPLRLVSSYLVWDGPVARIGVESSR